MQLITAQHFTCFLTPDMATKTMTYTASGDHITEKIDAMFGIVF